MAETFLLRPPLAPPAACLIDGEPAGLDEAIERAVEILLAAKAPLVMGLQRVTCDAQRAAVELADRLGAVLDPVDDSGRSPDHTAVQSIGAVTATLGEVASRADLVVYWNVDPMVTHPRHMERFARPPLVARGAEGIARRVIAVGMRRTATSQASDEFLQLGAAGDEAALTALRALVRAVAIDERATASQTGATVAQWAYLAERLKSARYAAIFHGPQHAEPVTELVHDLHEHTRAVALCLGPPPNAQGAVEVLTWQTGFPSAVDFGAGYPQHRPGEASAAAVLERREADAAVIIAVDPLESLGGRAAAGLRALPTIVLDQRLSPTAASAAVAFFTPRFGIETDGEIFRSDGVVLPLRSATPSTLPAVERILGQINQRLAARRP
ncbi:MAG: formylmethanofuran dehydrogenase subunit B [Planctomycetota bacterium]|nr:MAG: formylmethanofuran dehydrogenase subunit B [Planctomycetota bacterium]